MNWELLGISLMWRTFRRLTLPKVDFYINLKKVVGNTRTYGKVECTMKSQGETLDLYSPYMRQSINHHTNTTQIRPQQNAHTASKPCFVCVVGVNVLHFQIQWSSPETRAKPLQPTPVRPYRWDNLHSSQPLAAWNLLMGSRQAASLLPSIIHLLYSLSCLCTVCCLQAISYSFFQSHLPPHFIWLFLCIHTDERINYYILFFSYRGQIINHMSYRQM